MTNIKPPSKPHLKRGDVVLVRFPNSDLKTVKLRPALVIERDNLHTGLSQIVMAMISSNLTRANHTSRVLIQIATPEGKQSGLLSDSVVMTDNLATITDKALVRVVGSLPMDGVDVALRHTLRL